MRYSIKTWVCDNCGRHFRANRKHTGKRFCDMGCCAEYNKWKSQGKPIAARLREKYGKNNSEGEM